MSGPPTDTTRRERKRDVQKPRDVTTKKTRAWKRRLLFSAAALGLVMVVRRLRGRGRDRSAASGTAARDGESTVPTDDEGTTATDGESPDTVGTAGRSIARRLAMVAASTAVMVAVRRLRERTR